MTDNIKRHRAGMQFTERTSLATTCLTAAMRHPAAIMAILAIAPKLPADGAGRPLEGFSHRPDAIGLLMETGQRHAFFRLELSVRFGSWIHLMTLLDFRCCTSDLNPPPKP